MARVRTIVPKTCPECKSKQIKHALGKIWCAVCAWSNEDDPITSKEKQ